MASGQELAQYYVQIIPSADGIGKKIASAIDKDDPGTTAGTNIGKKLVKIIAGLGLGKIISQQISSAIAEGGALEQSIGGIEQIFGEGSQATEQLKKNAQEAFSYAQVSANDYMQQVTSFSARLMQGLGGDTDATVKYADMAIRQMSDNANTFGTDISSIQAAYQGFSRANWTMLDNLRLGYGGTASEMARLINDSGVMGKNFTATAKNVNSISFDKIIEAIQVVQDNMNITGKTSAEAADTLQGSAAAMKSSWSNLLADMAIGEDFSVAMKGFTESALNYGKNLLKMIGNILKEAPGVIGTIIQEMGPTILQNAENLVNNFISGIGSKSTTIINTGSEILLNVVKGISKALPNIAKTALNLVKEMAKALISNLPTLLKTGAQMIVSLLDGIVETIPQVLASAKEMVTEIWNIIKNINWLQLGKDIITMLINGIKNLFTTAQSTATQLGTDIHNKIKSINWLQLGKDVIQFIINGIKAMVSTIVSTVGTMASNMLSAIKNSDWAQKGKDVLTNLRDGLANKVTAVVNKVGEVVTGMKNSLNNGGWNGIGQNIMAGVQGGIAAKAASIAQAAADAVRNAYTAARRALKINSPSKVFAELGEFVDLGFAEGITDNTKVIDRAMEDMLSVADPGLNMSALQPRYGALSDAGNNYNYGGFSINVYAQNGQSVSDIADEVMDRINNQIIRQREVFG